MKEITPQDILVIEEFLELQERYFLARKEFYRKIRELRQKKVKRQTIKYHTHLSISRIRQIEKGE